MGMGQSLKYSRVEVELDVDVTIRRKAKEPGYRIEVPKARYDVAAENPDHPLADLVTYCRGRLVFHGTDEMIRGWVPFEGVPKRSVRGLIQAVRRCFPGRVYLIREDSKRMQRRAEIS